jgi:hypothetical protein
LAKDTDIDDSLISDSDRPDGKDNPTFFGGESSVGDRIEQLNKALSGAKDSFNTIKKNLTIQIIIWGGLCLLASILTVALFCHLFSITFEELWTWQYIYYTAIRITAISAVFYLGSFLFNMLKHTIELYQKVKSKLVVMNSMASFVESGITLDDRKLIFHKLISILVESDFNHSSSKENELKVNNEIFTLLEKLIKHNNEK